MSKIERNDNNFKLGRYAKFAKFENLYDTVNEMYKSGSKQSFMTLNIQFMVSQMMAILKQTSEDFSEVPNEIKWQIETHAKAFYRDYANKGFYLIENQIGFIYCLMTLISKNMISSSAGYEILTALSFIDNKNSFNDRENVLNKLKSSNKLDDIQGTTLHTDLFAPDQNAIDSIQSMIQNIPKVIKPAEKKTPKKNEVILIANTERIVLKPTPFDGSFEKYYQTLTEMRTDNITGKRSKKMAGQHKKPKVKDSKSLNQLNDDPLSLLCQETENDSIREAANKKGRIEEDLKNNPKAQLSINTVESNMETPKDCSRGSTNKE